MSDARSSVSSAARYPTFLHSELISRVDELYDRWSKVFNAENEFSEFIGFAPRCILRAGW